MRSMTPIYIAIMVIAALLWARECMADISGHYIREVRSGSNVICYYTTPRGEYAITQRGTSPCPRTIRVPR